MRALPELPMMDVRWREEVAGLPSSRRHERERDTFFLFFSLRPTIERMTRWYYMRVHLHTFLPHLQSASLCTPFCKCGSQRHPHLFELIVLFLCSTRFPKSTSSYPSLVQPHSLHIVKRDHSGTCLHLLLFFLVLPPIPLARAIETRVVRLIRRLALVGTL
jgi:hypothetical protein